MTTIVKAAIIYNGVIYDGWRHCTIGCYMVANNFCQRPYPSGKAQGFVTSEGNFVGRSEALKIAKEAGQFMVDVGPKEGLYSEMLWDANGAPHTTKDVYEK